MRRRSQMREVGGGKAGGVGRRREGVTTATAAWRRSRGADGRKGGRERAAGQPDSKPPPSTGAAGRATPSVARAEAGGGARASVAPCRRWGQRQPGQGDAPGLLPGDQEGHREKEREGGVSRGEHQTRDEAVSGTSQARERPARQSGPSPPDRAPKQQGGASLGTRVQRPGGPAAAEASPHLHPPYHAPPPPPKARPCRTAP